jgi:acyl carrier protein
MSDADATLLRCFALAFPDLPADALASASVDSVADWDSLHALVLLALLEEAFGIRIPSHDYPSLRSYAAVREYVAGAR